MVDLKSLLGLGYFPREVPPVFTTRGYANVVDASLGGLPNGFVDPPSTKLERYRLSQVGRISRQLSIPNPISYFRLCQEIANYWTALEQYVQKSPLSKSVPTAGLVKRAIIPQGYQRRQLLRIQSL